MPVLANACSDGMRSMAISAGSRTLRPKSRAVSTMRACVSVKAKSIIGEPYPQKKSVILK
jgi:hypothetical protein